MQLSLRTFVALVALAFVFTAYGQAASPAPQGQAPAAQAPAPAPAPAQQAPSQSVATAQGELLEVDTKASTFAIRTAASEMKFRYDDQTKVAGAQKGVAGLATMTGSQVTVQYKKEGANNIATSIEVRGGQAPAPGGAPAPGREPAPPGR